MFDGLKKKLSSITQSAEEDVEAEEPADDETGEQSPAEDTPQQSQERVPDQQPAEDTPQQPQGEPAQKPQDDAAHHSVSGETAQQPQGDATQQPQDEPSQQQQPPHQQPQNEAAQHADRTDESTASEQEPTDDEEEKEEDSGGRGLTEKAKIFATGKTVIDEDDLEAHLEELEFALLGNDVEMDVTQEILDGVEQNLVGETRRRLSSTGNLVKDSLREALYDVISVGQFDFDQRIQNTDKPVVIIFTGVNGVGKTTSIAKLSHYFEQRGLSTVLANGDTFRAGANEQLEQHARNLDKKVISHEKGSDPAAVIYDAVEYAEANDVDVVLGDTAGRLHTSDDLMDQLEKIDRVIDPDMTIFVDEAVAGQDAVNRASEFDDASEIDGTILTKADADPQGGAAISISYVTGKPILFLGTGQDYPDLERFEPEFIVDELLGEEE